MTYLTKIFIKLFMILLKENRKIIYRIFNKKKKMDLKKLNTSIFFYLPKIVEWEFQLQIRFTKIKK